MLGTEKVLQGISNDNKCLLEIMTDSSFCPTDFGLKGCICEEANCRECWKLALTEEVEV